MRNISKNRFIEALEARKDDVYVRILQDVSSLDCIRCEDLKILYHRACYKSYTSRRKCSYSMSEPTAVEPGHTTCITESFVPDSSINQLFNWEVFFLCEKKTFKKDSKLKKIESNDRRNNLRESAVFKNDQRIIKILDSEEFIDNAVYHSGCITKYLLRYTPVKSKFQEDDCPEFSVHDYAFKMLIADIHEDLTVRKQAFLMTQLL